MKGQLEENRQTNRVVFLERLSTLDKTGEERYNPFSASKRDSRQRCEQSSIKIIRVFKKKNNRDWQGEN